MSSIGDYSKLINLIPVDNQSAKIKRTVWEKYIDGPIIEEIFGSIFGNKEDVELSREDVRSETDTTTKIVKVLMWGYPTGGRGKNIKNILERIDYLSEVLLKEKKRNLTNDEAGELIRKFNSIRGLGISTWSKFLYFFDVEFDSKKCQIYDLKIVDSLNKKQFSELDGQNWKQDIDHYYKYIEKTHELAKNLDVSPDKIELFLFYFNLYYKFD